MMMKGRPNSSKASDMAASMYSQLVLSRIMCCKGVHDCLLPNKNSLAFPRARSGGSPLKDQPKPNRQFLFVPVHLPQPWWRLERF